MPKNSNILENSGLTFTVIPNYFLDHIAPTLSASELRVMLYIYRHTLGYQKLSDCLSYDQFLNGVTSRDGRCIDQGAKVSRGSLVGALASLETKGLIQRLHSRGQNKALTTTFQIQFNSFPTFIAKASKPVVANPVDINQNAGQEVQEAYLLTSTTETEIRAVQQPSKKSNEIVGKGSGPDNHFEVQKLDCEEPKFVPEEVQKSYLTKETSQNQKEINRAAEAIQLILNQIPGISLVEAKRLMDISFSKEKGRDLSYIQRLVTYVSSDPSIHTPAAVFTMLIKTNQDRTLKQGIDELHQSNLKTGQSGATFSLQKKEMSKRDIPNKKGPIDFSKYMPGGKYGYLFSSSSESLTFPD